MRRTTAILLGWFIILLANCCFGQSYNASHAFRSRTIARPSSYRSTNYSYNYGSSVSRSPYSYSSTRSDYRNSVYRSYSSSPSNYSSSLGQVSRARSAASVYSGAGLDASRGLYRPGLGASSFSSGRALMDSSSAGYGNGRRLRYGDY
jgi:hypothetical protein